MTALGTLPAHDELVVELRRLRERGLLRIRELQLPALNAVGTALGQPEPDPRAVEALLRRAAERLGDDDFGMSARYLFGLVQGTFGRKPTDLRERAALELGLAAETFRKDRERLIVARMADELLGLGAEAGDRPPAPEHRPEPGLIASTEHFTGRERELERLENDVLAGDSGICVVHGMPGAGKTALAVELAHRLAGSFPQGVLFLSVAAHTPGMGAQSPRDVMVRLLLRLEVAAEVIPAAAPDVAAVVARELAVRRLLIVLDDVESAAQIQPLLGANGLSRVLVTSRNRLTALDEATHLHLGVLPRPAAMTLFARVAGLPDPGPLVDRIAGLCGDLPLALRVLAARHRLDPFPDLAGLCAGLELERDRLAELDDGTRDVAAAFELSFGRLPAGARRTFLTLAAAPGPDLPLGAAAALLGQPERETRRRLDDLVAANLLERPSARRYRFHDLIAVYARERVLPAERGVAVARLVDWYLRSLALADRRLSPHRFRFAPVSGEEPVPDSFTYRDGLDWVTAELANLVAVTRAAGREGLDTHCWQLAYLLKAYLYLTKSWDAWRASHEPALAATRRLGDARAEALILNSLGLAALEQGETSPAERLYRSAQDLFSRAGDVHGVNTALANVAWVAFETGDYEAFLADLAAAHRFYVAEGMDRNAAIMRRGLSLGELRLGHADRAAEHAAAALDTFRRLGEARMDAAIALNNLAEAQAAAGDREAAQAAAIQAVGEARACGSVFEEARALARLGDLGAADGDPEAAVGHWTVAAELFESLSAPEARGLRARLSEYTS